MKRRELLKGLAVLPFLAQSALSNNGFKTSIKKRLIKPKRLAAGDTIGVVSPAGSLENEGFDKALQNLADLGFKTKIGKNARNINGYLAGTDKERLEDLHWAFSDQEVDAVWCARGGYGASRLLPYIDFKLIRRNPKLLIGYSDITALHLAIYEKCGLVTFHGPVAASTLSDYSKAHLINTIMRPLSPYKIELSPYTQTEEFNLSNERDANLYKTEVITKGKCRGRLIGGNLSLLSALAGTPFALRNLKGKILFIEEVNEQPYRIDRMLTQLLQTVNLKQAEGIALGVFKGCNPRGNTATQSLVDVLKDRLGNLGIPVIYGLSFGHIRDQFTLPIGIKAELDTEQASVTLLETSVL